MTRKIFFVKIGLKINSQLTQFNQLIWANSQNHGHHPIILSLLKLKYNHITSEVK